MGHQQIHECNKASNSIQSESPGRKNISSETWIPCGIPGNRVCLETFDAPIKPRVSLLAKAKVAKRSAGALLRQREPHSGILAVIVPCFVSSRCQRMLQFRALQAVRAVTVVRMCLPFGRRLAPQYLGRCC